MRNIIIFLFLIFIINVYGANYVFIKDNKAEVYISPGVEVKVKAKTNSEKIQKITLKNKNNKVDYVYTGSGEKTNIGDNTIINSDNIFYVSLEYSNDGVFKPSKIKSGGPYEIGNYNLMVIVAENGDDTDYNDSILEFSWYTKK